MTVISELDIDIVVTYLHVKNEVNRSKDSTVIIRTDTSETLPSRFRGW